MADFKTLQFSNTPGGQREKAQALTRESRAGWTIVSESVAAGEFKGGEACLLFLIFPPCAFLAGNTKGEITVTLQRAGGRGIGSTGAEFDTLPAAAFTAEQWRDRDGLLKDAARIVVEEGRASTSVLQRRLKIGYGRAARLIEELYTAGILGPDDAKERKVLVSPEDLDRILGDT